MLKRFGLYFHTLKSMKASQTYYRVRRMLHLDCGMGLRVTQDIEKAAPISAVQELDFDPKFLSRFSAEELMRNQVTFLHRSKPFDWDGKWSFDDESALWNFNLHYFEYLFPLIQRYRETKERRYLDHALLMISNWIRQKPQSQGGTGWAPYTIDLRLTNWLSFYAAVHMDLEPDFKRLFLQSIQEQYAYLSRHLEKDILGNHYFEDLKALLLCAVFFQDDEALPQILEAFASECREEILPDGMHFELSPMYHNIVFEGVIRAAAALRGYGQPSGTIEAFLQPMLNAAWSLEEGLDRIPLFNDAGNNVAKSLEALVLACSNHFGIAPEYTARLKESGFYIFKRKDWKLIVDAGQPGPSYIPGHAHCDAMSFELYQAGKPVITNCGTYAYQCDERSFFRSTAAHNTVMINEKEQSQCWGAFRMAKRSAVVVKALSDNGIVMEMTDYTGQKATRTIQFGEKLTIIDASAKNRLTAFLHILEDIPYSIEGNQQFVPQSYGPEYGQKTEINALMYTGSDQISAQIALDERS